MQTVSATKYWPSEDRELDDVQGDILDDQGHDQLEGEPVEDYHEGRAEENIVFDDEGDARSIHDTSEHSASSSSELDSDNSDVMSVASVPSSDATDTSNRENEDSDCSEVDSDGSDSNQFHSPDLYAGSCVSQDEAVLEIMKLFVKHKMEKTVVGSFLQTTLKLIPNNNNMPKSQHLLFQYVEKLCPISREIVHYYCSVCHFYLGTTEKHCTVPNCGNPPKKFYQLSISDQIKYLFEHQGLAEIIDKYESQRQSRSNNSLLSDLCDGSEFKRSRIPGKYNLTTLGHTDGIPISESSNMSMWPLENVISELPPHLRYKFVIICAIWIDESKPTLNTFLKPYVEELKLLATDGVKWIHPVTKESHTTFVTNPSFCVDAPVRSSIQNCQSFNSKYGCNMCEQKTKKLPQEPVQLGVQRKKRKRVFTFEENESTMRTAERMDLQGDKTLEIRRGKRPGQKFKAVKGVRGKSVVSSVPGCDRSTAVFPEYMHLLMCILKDFMKIWFEKDGPWSLKAHEDKINNFLESIRVPDFLTRIPRSTVYYSKWKANELRSFLLYYSLVILSECMTDNYFQHWILLVSAFNLLLQDSVTVTNIARAKVLLKMFCREFPKLYDPKFYTYYFHNLLHLHLVVERFGPLWSSSAFQFESFNGTLAKFIHGSKNQGQELINNLKLAFGVEVLSARVSQAAFASGMPVAEFRNKIKSFKFSAAQRQVLIANNITGQIFVFYRARVHRDIFTSVVYVRQKRRNNYTVCYKNSEDQKCYGEIQCFCECNDKKIALLSRFGIDHQRVFRHIATGTVISHIIPIKQTETIDLIALQSILFKVIRVGDFVCLRPNRYEVNL